MTENQEKIMGDGATCHYCRRAKCICDLVWTRKLEFTIPNYRPSALNKILYAPVKTRIRLKKLDREMIGLYAKLADITIAQGPRCVSLVIGLTGRQKEADADAYCKAVFDSLVHFRYLIGDREGQAVWGGVQYVRNGESFTTFKLEDLGV